ncbi:ATP-binding protein [Bauldia litoralis]|uniref:ATP-binding protein n=1 Tax=Bauldia litoralis TaxID=665467 RepID=UPI00329742A3
MASDDTEDKGSRIAPPEVPAFRRLFEARWIIVAFAALLAILALTGVVGWTPALVLLGGLVFFVALIGRSGSVARPASVSRPTEQIWPETGIKLFSEALPDPCMVLDRRGVVRFANSRAIAAFSIRPGDPLAFRLRVPDLLAAFDRVAKGGPAEGVEFAERVPTERWFAAWFAPFDAGHRQGNFIALILDDLTERHRSERIRVDFVANASHELRTPLASLAGFIETLQGPARNDTEARERFLGVMQEQANRMSRLVDDLLSLSRIEMKQHVRPSGEVDLCSVIRHLGDALEPLSSEMKVTIESDLPDAPVLVTGDRDELIQVFENLLENACKYGQSGGRVEVSVNPAREEEGPSVTVRDFGPGIPAEHIPRLTERFYRIDVDASRKHRGTGLGLAIVKHILARHQARMSVDSRPREGADFRVIFPQGAARDASASREIDETIQTVTVS